MTRMTAAILMVSLVTGSSASADEAEQIASTRALEAAKANTPPDRVYATFNRFCKENFGAEKEPLVYQKFGKDLRILPEGVWCHASDTSAVIGWDTNLPAKSYVEYGATVDYGRKRGATACPAPRRPSLPHIPSR